MPFSFSSILDMPDIESFPHREVLHMMHFFHVIDKKDDGCGSAQASIRRQFRLNCAGAFERRWRMYKQIFQNTYYKFSLRVVSRRVHGDFHARRMILEDGEWLRYPFLRREIVNLVIDIQLSANANEQVAILPAIEELTDDMPCLKQIAVLAHSNLDAGVAAVVWKYFGERFSNLARRKGIEIELTDARWG
jgi:hypothetical protein